MHKLRERGESDLGKLENEDWLMACRYSNEVAFRAEFRLVQLKIMHRAYFTRTRLFKMGRLENYCCLRGCQQAGTLLHTI